ncbi:4371_t:CDS:2, partial [Scutellospora calospora]
NVRIAYNILCEHKVFDWHGEKQTRKERQNKPQNLKVRDPI